jgi:hypothetical protein
MSAVVGPQAATTHEMITYHRKRITGAEAEVLANPTEENLSRLRETLDASKQWRESQS